MLGKLHFSGILVWCQKVGQGDVSLVVLLNGLNARF
jgi:hypothetical protein